MNNCDLKKQKSEIRLKLKQNWAALPDQTRQLYSETISEQLLSLEEMMSARTVFILITDFSVTIRSTGMSVSSIGR